MTFVAGSVFGSTGCNRYNAGVSLTGEGLTIMPGPMTMMACDDPAGAVEQGFMAALATVTRFDFDEDTGALLLMAQDRPVVTARPAP
jgi:heat shock protein HslJ